MEWFSLSYSITYEYSPLCFSLSGKAIYLKDLSQICCCHPWVNLPWLEVLDRATLVKFCFPKPHLSLRADKKVSVDLGPRPGVCEREIEGSIEGNMEECGKRRISKIKIWDISIVDSLLCLPKRKKRGIKLKSSRMIKHASFY